MRNFKCSDALQIARDKITRFENWTRGSYARDKDRNEISVYHEEATCFCSVGTLMRSVYELDANSSKTNDCLEYLPADIIIINDTSPHVFILKMFDEAIKKAKLKGD